MSQLGAFLTGVYEQKQQREQEDKQRARKFKSLVDYADTAGIMPKDRAMTMDVDSLEGAVQGYAAKQKFQEVGAQLKRFAQEQQASQALTNFARDFAQGDTVNAVRAGQAGSMLNFQNPGFGGDEATPRPAINPFMLRPTADEAAAAAGMPAADRLRFALGENPAAMAAPQFDNSLNVLRQFAGIGGEDLTPQVYEDPKTHARIYRSGKSNIPIGVNPDALPDGPAISPDGEFYHNGKSWVHVRQTGAPPGSKFVNVNGAIALQAPDGRVISWKMENPQAEVMRAIADTIGKKQEQTKKSRFKIIEVK